MSITTRALRLASLSAQGGPTTGIFGASLARTKHVEIERASVHADPALHQFHIEITHDTAGVSTKVTEEPQALRAAKETFGVDRILLGHRAIS